MESRWETLKSERKQREGSKTFIEVKVTKDNEKDRKFVSIAKGFVGFDGNARYNKAVSINFDEIDFIIDALNKMRE